MDGATEGRVMIMTFGAHWEAACAISGSMIERIPTMNVNVQLQNSTAR